MTPGVPPLLRRIGHDGSLRRCLPARTGLGPAPSVVNLVLKILEKR
ncbi:Uncharacterised protein [Acinetobacter baumannii]|nr:Uncharacterised protein [Acinetobacter baumannii]